VRGSIVVEDSEDEIDFTQIVNDDDRAETEKYFN
jgi:hypothetical protein